MAEDPVATAASNNPLLKTLVAAVSGELNQDVNLVDTLNGGEFTVFAPVDDAFAKLDQATLDDARHRRRRQDARQRPDLPRHRRARSRPTTIDGTQQDRQRCGRSRSPARATTSEVGDQASVICGGVKTANATVYLIDTVLMPPAA